MTFEQWWSRQPITQNVKPSFEIIVKSFEEIARQAWIAGAASVPPVAIAPALAVDETIVIKTDYNDIDHMVTEFLREKGFRSKNFDKYGYECVAENEWSNYQEHSFTVESIDYKGKEQISCSDSRVPFLGDILNWMCFDGKLKAGTYLIKVYW